MKYLLKALELLRKYSKSGRLIKMKQRVNMDIDKELWKRVGMKALELDMQKKDLVELALKKLLQSGSR